MASWVSTCRNPAPVFPGELSSCVCCLLVNAPVSSTTSSDDLESYLATLIVAGQRKISRNKVDQVGKLMNSA